MSNRTDQAIGFALCALLIGTLPREVVAQADGQAGETGTQWGEQLAAQRREIEEIKIIFARIDRRLIQIDAIHQRIERILSNPDATVVCVALEGIQLTQTRLATAIEKAQTEQERARLESDQVNYRAVFKRAQAAFKKFDCLE